MEPQQLKAAEAAEEAVIEAVIEAVEEASAEEVVEVEEEDQVVVEEDQRKNGLHLPSLEDSSKTDTSNPSKKFILTPSQSRKPLSLIDSSLTTKPSFPMKSCASCPCKSKLRLVKELDSRLLSLLVTEEVTLVLVSNAPRKSKLPSRVLSLMLSSTLSQSEEVTGVPESVVSIPSQSRLRESAVLVPLE
jgi:hypothetical protein